MNPGAQPYHILFVCMGNICRSPAGENVMRAALDAEGIADQFVLDSAGTISLHTGNPPDERMRQAAATRGVPMRGSARQVNRRDFTTFDLVLAMDDENYFELREIADSVAPDAAGRLLPFCEFCTEHEDREVPDPYYGGSAGFEKVLDLLEDGCAELIRRWRAGNLPHRSPS